MAEEYSRDEVETRLRQAYIEARAAFDKAGPGGKGEARQQALAALARFTRFVLTGGMDEADG